MNAAKKALATIATTVALSTSFSANATLQNWYVDTDGAGSNAAVLVNDYLDLVGQAYVKNTFTGPTQFSFNEYGKFTTATADGGSLLGGVDLSPALSSVFVGSGTGNIGGNLTFATGGSLTVFSGANQIASFQLVEGTAALNANNTLPNGAVSLVFKATTLSAGYFYNSAMVDLSNLLSQPGGIVLGFATTNAIDLSRDRVVNGLPVDGGVNVNSGLIAGYNAAFGTSLGTVNANQITDLYISNNGQFRMEVPEPAGLALVGVALLGLGASRRRRSA